MIRKRKYDRDWHSTHYKEWKKKVRKRDNYTCQYPGCKVRYRGVQVHHIIKYASSVYLRYVETNGICLCRDCHNKIKGKEDYYVELFLSIIKEKLK